MSRPWRGQPTPEEFWAYTTKTEAGCWLWKGSVIRQSNGTPGYGYCWWKGRRDRAHRVAYELSTGLPAPTKESGKVVMHRCDVALCVNPSHLRIGTFCDNSLDMANKGRSGPGGYNAVLDEDAVRSIRKLCAMGFKRKALAELVNISTGVINNIASGRTWQHVE